MRSAQLLKIDARSVKVRVSARFRRAGSIVAGTVNAGCDGVTLQVEMDSDESPERIAELIRVAERSCYTAGALREPVPVELGAVINGQPLAISVTA